MFKTLFHADPGDLDRADPVRPTDCMTLTIGQFGRLWPVPEV